MTVRQPDAQARSVWVTGAAGFIGRHLCRQLELDGVKIIRFDRSGGQLEVLPLSQDGFDAALMQSGAPSAIYHLAGGSTVGASMEDPVADFDSNVGTTVAVINAVKRICPEAPIYFASSAAVYGTAHAGAINIDAATVPTSPYGWHKKSAEDIACGYAGMFGLSITVLRLFSIYGPNIGKQLIFDICRRFAEGERHLTLGGTGAERRDWCHVSDAVAALTTTRPASPGEPVIYNVGTGVATETSDVARLIAEAWGGKRSIEFSGAARAGDPFSLYVDPASLPPDFTPKISFEQGVSEFVASFRMGRPET